MSTRSLALAMATFVVLAVGGTLALAPFGQQSLAVMPVAPPAEQARQVPVSDGQVKLSFAPVVKAVTPSVVNVYATTIVQQSASPFASDPFFQRFFGGQGQFQSRPRESQSLGSGVMVDPSGVILTNRHVIENATDVRIALSDGREYAVDVAIEDAQTDLAVLRIRDPKGATFPAITFADSDALQVGDLVLAIGNPFGVGQTVTSGIVSGLARTGVESSDYEFFIQTDAAINPGNSGGALVDLDGHLVGINTAIYSQSGGSVGIGFAIPANMARLVADAGVSGGAIVRPWFGAKMQAVTSDIANSLGMVAPHGAVITEVAPDGPAAKAGFASGDVILAVDGVAVDDPSAFNFRLATKPIGQKTTLQRVRGGKTEDVPFDVEAAPVPAPDMMATVNGDSRFSGTTVRQLTPDLAEAKGLPYDAKVFEQTASQRVRTWQVILQRGGRVLRSIVSG
ncbi:MAG: Do family serine endopeptidase [Cypionkella sp.]